MGYGHRIEAGKVRESWSKGCLAQTGSGNAFIDDRGVRYFFETTRMDQPDGGICGTIHKHVQTDPDGTEYYRKSGSFRINGDGTIERAPKKLKEFSNEFRSQSIPG